MLTFIIAWFAAGALVTLVFFNPFSNSGQNASEDLTDSARLPASLAMRNRVVTTPTRVGPGQFTGDDMRAGNVVIFPVHRVAYAEEARRDHA